MSEILEARRKDNQERLERLRQDLRSAEEMAGDSACVYLTGSFARGEASGHSDLDLFIVGRGARGQRKLPRLDEICIKADLIETTRKHGFPEFSGDGEYLVHHTKGDLVGTLGRPEDDASNTFTARLLLLLESKPLLCRAVYNDIIKDVVAAYWRDYEDHKASFMPAFLANDILRLWRTFCVNYEARTETDPVEKKAKRKVTVHAATAVRVPVRRCAGRSDGVGVPWSAAAHASLRKP
jgi:predicted nucleotidyltransferase